MFSTPGLTFYIEAQQLGINVHYLLPSNYSQALLLEKYKELGDASFSISSFGDEYIIPQKLDEDDGIELTRSLVKDILVNHNNDLYQEIKAITSDVEPDKTLKVKKASIDCSSQIANILKKEVLRDNA